MSTTTWSALRSSGTARRTATAEAVHAHGEAGLILLEAARGVGARLLVAGAFGHPRLQRFIFGGSTEVLLDGRASGLFLSH